MAENKKMEEKKPLTLEQVKQIANNLYKENMQLKAIINDRDAILSQLEYLFKVVESTYPFEKSFRDECANKIIKFMSPVEEKEKENKDKSSK